MSRLLSKPFRLQCVAVVALLSSCSDDDVRQVEIPLDWEAPTPSPLVFDEAPPAEEVPGLGGGPSESGDDGDEADDEGDESGTPPSAIEIDRPRMLSIYCGDGAWDPASEECDAGPTELDDERAICTASCQTRDVLAVEPIEGGEYGSRRLGLGRHAMAGSELSGGVVWVEQGAPESLPDASDGSIPQVILQTLEIGGSLGERVVVADKAKGDHPVLASNPVVAALPDGRLAVAYNDLNGDGSELGIALRYYSREDSSANTGPWVLGTSRFANTTTFGAQQDADLVWTRSGLVTAWADWSDTFGARIVSRTVMSDDFGAASSELPLSEVLPAVGGVALAALPFSGLSESVTDRTWAAVYRSGREGGAEEIVLRSQESALSIQPAWVNGEPGDASDVAEDPEGSAGASSNDDVVPLMPGHMEDRPAVAHLSGDRALVAFTVGTDPNDTGVASVFRIWLAVVHWEYELVESMFELEPTHPSWLAGSNRSLRQPVLATTVEGQVYLAWRSEGSLGKSEGDELWLKRFDWDSESGELITDHPEVPLAREVNASGGDQRTPVLASMRVPGMGSLGAPALGIAFEDWGVQYDNDQGRPDVLVQLAPTPLRRGLVISDECSTGSCELGEGPCSNDADCADDLECHSERGPWYGRGHKVPVCEPAHCNNHQLDGDEAGVDCGGSCGQCFECLDDTTYLGTADYCSLVCSCEPREGDCDADYECEPGLSCVEEVGEQVGFPAPIDLCDFGHCHDEEKNFDETRLDCGGADCLPCENGTPTYCLGVACDVGEGDCLQPEALCGEGLVCSTTDAPLFGLSEDVGVCVEVTCPADRGDPYDPDFCTEDCKCPSGYGLCDSDAECVGSKCVAGRGLYFELAAEDAVCIPDHCFDHIQNFDETSLDCGGVCGTECPICDVDPSFRSVEDSSLWGITSYSPVGFTPSNFVTSSDVATDGNSSLAYTGCGYLSVSSDLFDGKQFEIIGDKLFVDVRAVIGAGGNDWDWAGGMDVVIQVNGESFQLFASKTWTRAQANEWQHVSFDVPQHVQDAFLGGQADLRWRLGMNRNCSVAGSDGGAFLVDHFRFGGVAAFRSDCAPGGGGDGTGGSSGTGGGTGTGGSGTGGSGTGGSGTGGAGTGGAGGQLADLFGFEDLSLWNNASDSSSDATQGSQSLAISSSGFSSTSVPFKAASLGPKALLTLDYRLPADVTPGSVNGQLELTLDCPSAGLWGNYLGQIGFWDKANEVWLPGSFQLTSAQVTALSGVANCTLRLSASINGHQAGDALLVDNLRFEDPGYCLGNQQLNTAPFVSGVSPLPNGSPERPYRICTAAQLQAVSTTPALWDSAFQLEADLDVSSIQNSIGRSDDPFQGSFDGQGHALSNLNLSGTTEVGLFGHIAGDGILDGVDDGLVEDLVILDSQVSGSSFVGVLAGVVDGGVVRNVDIWNGIVQTWQGTAGGAIGSNTGRVMNLQVQATVTGPGTQLGGAVGLNAGMIEDAIALGSVTGNGGSGAIGGFVGRSLGGKLEACQSHGDVVGAVENAGGLVGAAEQGAQIVESWASGQVTSSADSVGGLVGLLEGSLVEGSLATGPVTGTADVGGLAGAVSDGQFVRCSAAGAVSGGTRVGGLLGSAVLSSKITKCAGRGSVIGSGANVGGLVGIAQTIEVRDSFASGFTEGESNVGGLIGSMEEGTLIRTYASGAVVSQLGSSGALLGLMDVASAMSRSYANQEVNPGLPAVGNVAEPEGLKLLSLADFALRSTFKGWNFYDDWILNSAEPDLRFEAQCDAELACAPGLTCESGECTAVPATTPVMASRVDQQSRSAGNDAQIAVDHEGRRLVFFRQSTLDASSNAWNLPYVSTYDPIAGTWGSQLQLSNAPLNIRNMKTLITPEGYGVVVWTEGYWDVDPLVRLWAAVVKMDTGVWSLPVELSNGSGYNPETADMAVLPNGDLLIAWAEGHPAARINRTTLNPETLEVSPQQTFALASDRTVDAWLPQVAVNDDGIAAIAWMEDGPTQIEGPRGPERGAIVVVSVADMNQSNPTWSVPRRVNDDISIGVFTDGIDVAITRSGEVTVVHASYKALAVGYSYALLASRCLATSGTCNDWSEEVAADLWSTGLSFYSPTISMGPSGEAWVIARTELRAPQAPDGVPSYHEHVIQLSGGEWSEPVQISAAMTATSNNRWNPNVGVDHAGNAVATWVDDGQAIIRRYDNDWDRWEDPIVLNAAIPATVASTPRVSVAPNGVTGSVWVQRVSAGIYHVYSGGLN